MDTATPSAPAVASLQNLPNTPTQARASSAPDPTKSPAPNVSGSSPDPTKSPGSRSTTPQASSATKDSVPATKAEDKATQAAPTKIKVKVDGQEREVTLQDLTRDYELREGSKRRFSDADRMRKEAETIIKNWQSQTQNFIKNPEAALAELEKHGVNVDELVQARALRTLEKRLMTPEERELEDLRQFRSGHEKTAAERAEAETKAHEMAKREESTNRVSHHIDTEIHKVFLAAGIDPSVPEGAEIASFIGNIMLASLRSQEGPINAQEAYRRFMRSHIGITNHFLRRYAPTPEKLKSIYPDLFKMSRAASISEVKPNVPSFAPGRAPQAQKSSKPEPMTFREKMNKEYGIKL